MAIFLSVASFHILFGIFDGNIGGSGSGYGMSIFLSVTTFIFPLGFLKIISEGVARVVALPLTRSLAT